LNFILIFIGGGLGAALRHAVNLLALRTVGTDFPIGTLAINVLGSLLMGMAAEYFALRGGVSIRTQLFLTTGVLGGFTTFSAFSLETALLYQRGQTAPALLYASASLVLAVGGLFAGMALMRLAID
jgi:fluoride exporter